MDIEWEYVDPNDPKHSIEQLEADLNAAFGDTGGIVAIGDGLGQTPFWSAGLSINEKVQAFDPKSGIKFSESDVSIHLRVESQGEGFISYLDVLVKPDIHLFSVAETSPTLEEAKAEVEDQAKRIYLVFSPGSVS